MVTLLVRIGNDGNETLLHRCSISSDVFRVINDLTLKWNLRTKLSVACEYVNELVKFGPYKAEKERGMYQEQEQQIQSIGVQPKGMSNNAVENCLERSGEPLEGRMLELIAEIISASKEIVSLSSSQEVEIIEYQEKIDLLRGAIMMAYPFGLPCYEPVYSILNPMNELKIHEQIENCFNPENTELWWAGKIFPKNENLGVRIGNNEKSTIKCRMIRANSGIPLREPIVSDVERKAMMSLYYRKLEESKKLKENDDDFYLNQSWADPNLLKNTLQGTSNIRMF